VHDKIFAFLGSDLQLHDDGGVRGIDRFAHAQEAPTGSRYRARPVRRRRYQSPRRPSVDDDLVGVRGSVDDAGAASRVLLGQAGCAAG
jgi:hypothetical protein